MRNKRHWQSRYTALLVLLLLLIDQVIKVAVKTHMMLQEEIYITDWFRIYFIENPGMAYGITIGSKLLLTLLRIIAISIAAYAVVQISKAQRWSMGFMASLAAVLAGGLGNILDSIFYGVIFGDSHGQVASLFPPEGGYTSWFYGKVVDMFYFPLFTTTYPEWFPIVGGEEFTFFSAIFNFADACICVGGFFLIVCYPRTLFKAMGMVKKPHWLTRRQ